MLTVVKFEDLGKAPARIEDDQDKEDAGETHALATNRRSQGGREVEGGGAREDKGSHGGRSKRERGRHQQ